MRAFEARVIGAQTRLYPLSSVLRPGPFLGPRIAAAVFLASGCVAAWSQVSTPDAGSLLRDTQRALPTPQAPPRLQPAPAPVAARPGDGLLFSVTRFDLAGITLIAPAEVQAVIKPWLGREIAFADLEKATQAIGSLYQERGWYARAQVPEQDVVDGVVRIEIIEAQLGAIRFADVERWPLSRERIERVFGRRQALGQPLSLSAMNRSVSVLNDMPGVSVKAALDASEKPGATDLLISVSAKPAFSGSASTDNQGSRSTGEIRASVNLSWDNPAAIGDQVSANLMGSEGVRYMRLAYAFPLGDDGLRLSVYGSALRYQLVGSFDTPGGTFGSAWTRGAVLAYPWLRSAAGNVNLSLTFNDADYVNYANGLETSRKAGRTTTINIGGDLYDEWAGGGTNVWGLSWVTGRVNSSLHKFTTNLARLQRLSPQTSLWLSFNGQRSLNNLDSSEKFALGGSQAVRAYPGAQGSGDHGWLATVEARHSLRADLQITAFIDRGGVSFSRDPQQVPPDNLQRLNSYRLQGWGVGLNYAITPKTSAKLTLARRIGSNPVPSATGKDADGTRILNRAWLNLSTFF